MSASKSTSGFSQTMFVNRRRQIRIDPGLMPMPFTLCCRHARVLANACSSSARKRVQCEALATLATKSCSGRYLSSLMNDRRRGLVDALLTPRRLAMSGPWQRAQLDPTSKRGPWLHWVKASQLTLSRMRATQQVRHVCDGHSHMLLNLWPRTATCPPPV
eukprot:473075-Prymnesium_polylepis.2